MKKDKPRRQHHPPLVIPTPYLVAAAIISSKIFVKIKPIVIISVVIAIRRYGITFPNNVNIDRIICLEQAFILFIFSI
jgi:hypothetical protein